MFLKYILYDPNGYLVGSYRGTTEYNGRTVGVLKCGQDLYCDLDRLAPFSNLAVLLTCTGRRDITAYY